MFASLRGHAVRWVLGRPMRRWVTPDRNAQGSLVVQVLGGPFRPLLLLDVFPKLHHAASTASSTSCRPAL